MGMSQQVVEVWGDFACFTRPDLKVERLSYPTMTPSAARGILDAIYCKPKEFRWQVRRICMLSPPSYIALRRNEVKEKASVRAVEEWMRGAEPQPIYADVDKSFWGSDMRGRTQRQTMALKDVKYRIAAEIRPWPGFEAHRAALEAQFRRRAAHGKCFYQPCFGCREFPAFFRLVEDDADTATGAAFSADLGFMLYDVFDLSRPGSAEDAQSISLFRAVVRDGVLDVPEYDDPAVLKVSGRAL